MAVTSSCLAVHVRPAFRPAAGRSSTTTPSCPLSRVGRYPAGGRRAKKATLPPFAAAEVRPAPLDELLEAPSSIQRSLRPGDANRTANCGGLDASARAWETRWRKHETLTHALLEIRLLGPFEVLADGRVADVGGSKRQALLAMLALREVASSTSTHSSTACGGSSSRPPRAMRSTTTSRVFAPRWERRRSRARPTGIR